VTRLAYCDRSEDPDTVSDLVEGRILDGGERYDALLPSRLDFDIRIIKLPAIPVREIDGFLRYRSRSLYPGQPGETSIDYSLLKFRGDRYAVLVLAKSTTVESYRKAAGGNPLVLPFSAYKSYLKRFSRQTVVCSFWHRDWIDLLILSSETGMHSTVIKRAGSFERDWARFQRELPDEISEDAMWLLFCGSGERDAIGNAATEEDQKIRFISLEELDPKPLRREAVFSGKRAVSRTQSWFTVPLLAAVLLFFSVLLIKKGIDRREVYLNQLRQVYAEYEQSTKHIAGIESELGSLIGRRERLAARVPIQPYTVLSELWEVLGSDTSIQSFTLNNRTFELEAIGTEPLEKMKQFGEQDHFQDVKLLQIIPLAETDRELFRIRGAVKVE
jgi:hypothetical protein